MCRRSTRSTRSPAPTRSGVSPPRRARSTSRRASRATSSRSCGTTRADTRLYLGASPRSGIALLRVAKARALADGRDYLVPDDVKAVAQSVLSHRLILGPEARSAGLGGARDRRRGAREDPRSRMTRRGRAVLALGFFVYLAAWVFGSRALYPVATGLLFAVALARRLGPASRIGRRRSAATARARDVIEGDDVRIDLELTATGAVAPPTLVAHERPGRLAERRVELHRVGRRRFAGGYELRARAARPLRVRDRSPDDRGSVRPRRARRSSKASRRRSSSTRGSSHSTGCSPRAARTRRTGGGCCCGGRPATSCTASGTTPRASRSARCTGARPRGAGG